MYPEPRFVVGDGTGPIEALLVLAVLIPLVVYILVGMVRGRLRRQASRDGERTE